MLLNLDGALALAFVGIEGIHQCHGHIDLFCRGVFRQRVLVPFRHKFRDSGLFPDGRQKIFATLGDWTRHKSYLAYEDGRFQLCYYQAPE